MVSQVIDGTGLLQTIPYTFAIRGSAMKQATQRICLEEPQKGIQAEQLNNGLAWPARPFTMDSNGLHD